MVEEGDGKVDAGWEERCWQLRKFSGTELCVDSYSYAVTINSHTREGI
jgi:hypothetical protein